MSPLRRFAPALPEGEPRDWWVSMDGGRVKGLVGVDGRRGSQESGGHRWTEGEPRVRWVLMDGGRVKGAVGLDGRRERQGCGGYR